MNLYKITEGPWAGYTEQETQAAAEAVAAGLTKLQGKVLGVDYTVTLEKENIDVDTYQAKLDKAEADKQFGSMLVSHFKADNAVWAEENREITKAESDEMMGTFQLALGYANTGSIQEARETLAAINTTVIFTQARKDKYLAMMDDYLA